MQHATCNMQACNIQRTTYSLQHTTCNVRRCLGSRAPAQSLRPRRARDVPTLASELVVFAYEPMRQSHDTLLQARPQRY